MPDPQTPSWWQSLPGAPKPDAAGEFAARTVGPGISRRAFLAGAGAVAGAVLSSCDHAPATLVPAATLSPELTPGVARHYATHLAIDGYAVGVLATCHEGRPTKLEGNPDHPASRGASSAPIQAALRDLYDPARDQPVRCGAEPRAWSELRALLHPDRWGDGEGVHLLLGPTSSPTAARLLGQIRQRLPRLRIFGHPRHDQAPALDASQRLLGRELQVVPQVASARSVLVLGGDPLAQGPDHLRLARDWSHSRRLRTPSEPMSRWWVAESTPTSTGWSADERLRLDERLLPAFAARLLGAIAERRPAQLPASLVQQLTAVPLPGVDPRWLTACAHELDAAGAAGLVLAGAHQPELVQACAWAARALLGAHGVSATCAAPALVAGARDELAAWCEAPPARLLVVLDCDPLATGTHQGAVAEALARAQESCYVGPLPAATARAVHWVVPTRHPLEGWSDGLAVDGTPSVAQPLIDPLFATGETLQVLQALATGSDDDGQALVRTTWRERGLDDDAWHELLRRGVGTTPAALAPPAPRWEALAALVGALPPPVPARIDCLLYEDKIAGGERASNDWLQELPDPITKLTWDNALLIAPSLARELGLATGRQVVVRAGSGTIEVPVVIQPGQAERTVALALGYGARGIGVDAQPLRRKGQSWLIEDVALQPLGATTPLAITQEHWTLDGRPIAVEASREEWRAHPELHPQPLEPTLRERVPVGSPQWGMVIDLAKCTGCSGCVIACQAENNIPTVGRTGVLRGREMHWLRIDRYYRGDPEAPKAISQPMTCQHCEHAPCEYVCPTYATAHSQDGLNEMTYNRCVGTRFCSNNCPYKVRRFNWYNFHAGDPPVRALLHNPNVTVRARGVMEKCTYCVQRIRAADITAREEGRAIRDGEVVTACQQACPTQAIIFGNISDPTSEVTQARGEGRAYGVLDSTGSQPRTRYLADIRNPSPELA